MSWQFEETISPSGYGVFEIQMWSGQTGIVSQPTQREIIFSLLLDNVAYISFLGTSSDLDAGNTVIVEGVGAPYDGTFVLLTAYANVISYALVGADLDQDYCTGTLSWGDLQEVPVTKHNVTSVTWFRDAPTQIVDLEFVDPFGDATAQIEFPQCTGFDSPNNEETWWLRKNVNVDIMWVPATTVPSAYPCINPITNDWGMYLHPEDSRIVWEGFTIKVNPSVSGVSMMLQGCLWQVDRYYAKPMFPLQPKTMESMFARYFDPRRRGLYTAPMKIDWSGVYSGMDQFSSVNYPRVYTQTDYNQFHKKDKIGHRFIPTDLEVGDYWTGYVTRYTGGWDKALTSYIASQLSFMYYAPPTPNDPAVTGITPGDTWSITKTAGRTPLMYLKRQGKTPNLYLWYGQPGAEISLDEDGTQISNVIFGQGKEYDGTTWMTQNFQPKAPWSSWSPLAWDSPDEGGRIYHWDDWSNQLRADLYDGYDAQNERDNDIWVQERNWTGIPDGIVQSDAVDIATQYIARHRICGWYGSIDLKVDLWDANGAIVSKWNIKIGDVICLKGFQGEMDPVKGVNVFHVAKVNFYPMEGRVALTIDTKFRELLSIEEAKEHTRDSMAPVKMLLAGRQSIMVEDLAMAWNTGQGAGCFPTDSIKMEKETVFPYVEDTKLFPPKNLLEPFYIDGHAQMGMFDKRSQLITEDDETSGSKGAGLASCYIDKDKQFYVPINCGNPVKTLRWGFQPVIMSQAGTIARTEFACYDKHGELAEVEFHVSVFKHYKFDVTSMPNEIVLYDDQDPPEPTNLKSAADGYAALWRGAFNSINPDTGLQWGAGANLRYQYHMPAADARWDTGWGTYERPAGYSPGAKDKGDKPTGMLLDGAQWPFSMEKEFATSVETDDTVQPNSYKWGFAVYVQNILNHTKQYEWVYVMGRVYRQPQTGR